ncbi:trehalose-6-phosphate synthase [Thermogymnomonas acidicola]|uniref:trehalose-6-phosphate synthase n=1 Tax=Thermogymnomonas acidicola TaxID=399579 RepID=UPI0009468698|nr:trehalose-6-phosphate synthase [Thermogymnomonas acidicola]
MSYLIVTSRCPPITHEQSKGKETVKENVGGGVATALRKLMQREGGVWVCWGGDGNLDSNYEVEDLGKYKIVRVILNRTEKEGFYDEYSNGTLWPLFHYFRDRIKMSHSAFKAYRAVNEKFAEKISKYIENDMIVWIHDYQLTLVPGMLREKGIENVIVFTWHIPWVAGEFFAILPESAQMIRSIASSDLVTFHTEVYLKNFLNSYRMLVGDSSELEKKLMALPPLGIDDAYYRMRRGKKMKRELLEGKKIIFSIDRLDYTKGLTNRVLAIENLLKRYPEYVAGSCT